MELILTAHQSKLIDEIAINKFGYNSLQLMENASFNIYFHLIDIIKKHNLRKISIITGNGNNGGDGYATARHLINSKELCSYIDEIYIVHVGNIERMTSDTKVNYNILTKISQFNKKIKILHFNTLKSKQDKNNIIIEINPDLILECLVGVGVAGILKNETAELISLVNSYAQNNKHVKVIAIDNPAGINVDNGEIIQENNIQSEYIKVNYTFTMFSKKLGMVLKNNLKPNNKNNNNENSNIGLYGEIKICDIGISQNMLSDELIFSEFKLNFESNLNQVYKQLNINDFRNILPSRDDISSKFNFGKVGIFTGERNMSGAAVLASNAALTIGSGLVYLFTDKSQNWGSLKPEVIKTELDFFDFENMSSDSMNDYANLIITKNNINTWLIGPGLGNNIYLQEFLVIFINILIQKNKFIILDADALKVFHKLHLNKQKNKNLILTPHIIEFYRLFFEMNNNENIAEIDSDKLNNLKINFLEYSQYFANKYNLNLHLKFFPSITTNGEISYFNDNYNSALSKGGSGDVLSGIIAGILTQKLSNYDLNVKSKTGRQLNDESILNVIAISSIIQSYLANKYTENYNKESMNATNVIELINILP